MCMLLLAVVFQQNRPEDRQKKTPKTKTGKHLLLTLSDMLPFHLILAHISPLPVAGTLLLDWMSTRLSHILEQGHTAPAILGRP